MNLIQMVNRLLPRLREGKVSSTVVNEYSLLLVEFINEGLDEVQGRYMWSSLDHIVELSTVPGQSEYALAETKEKSLLRMVDDVPQIYIDSGAEDPQRPKLISNFKLEDMYQRNALEPGRPEYCALHRNTDGSGWVLRLYPVPNAVFTVRVKFWTPQDPYEFDGSTDGVDFRAPASPIYAYAKMMAANERGEEMGEPGNLLERRYYATLGEAIENEIGYDGAGNIHEFRKD